MPDWALVFVGAAVVFAIAYVLGRSSGGAPEAAPAGAAAVPPPEAKPAPEKAKPAAAKEPTKEAKSAGALPQMNDESEDDEVDPTKIGVLAPKRAAVQPPANSILLDEDAAVDEPTLASALILVSATAQTDKGLRRKNNEDNLLVLPEKGVYVVADGMGGYAGGEIASELAVRTIERAFNDGTFDGEPHTSIPARASELARAIQMANIAILERAESDKQLAGMGTTVCAARFSPNKQRLYVGHVGDSRIYRMRKDVLTQITKDHTMKDLGATGASAGLLSRAVGIWPTVPIDVLMAKPEPGDYYLLCSDGLTKMLNDDMIAGTIQAGTTPAEIVENLIGKANARGGKDNITVILISVLDARESLRPVGTS